MLDVYAALAFSGAVHMIDDVVTTLPITVNEGDVIGAAWNAVTGSVLFTWNGVALMNPDGPASSPCKLCVCTCSYAAGLCNMEQSVHVKSF